jgi:hypothetical protein
MMEGYWTRHRLLPSLILAVALAVVTVFLFVSPYVEQQASSYNAQSVYKNSDIDFIVPEPSFDQVSELPGTNGVDKVFPFYLTKTEVKVNGKSRTTTVLLSDQFENVGMTMYNDSRLLGKSSGDVDNPIFVDWQFSKDTSAKVGDTISFALGGNTVEFTIAAVYETNNIYDGGAILAEITQDQKDAVAENANSNGYSGAYISATDYNVCRSYLTTDYRPLGRLKNRDQFESEEQYNTHYDAIMSSGYANEITDFRVRENDLDSKQSSLMILVGALLEAVILIVFNVIMANRGCEKGYFKKHCIPKGQNVKSYYTISFLFEMIASIILFIGVMFVNAKMAKDYVPSSAYGIVIAAIPAAIIIAEIIALAMNNSKVAVITAKVKQEQAKAEAEARAKAAEQSQTVHDGAASKKES